MAISATIEVKVEYDTPVPAPVPPPDVSPATVDDKVSDTSNSSLSGSGDSSGASTDKTEPNGQGGSDQTAQRNPVPAGTQFKKATVTLKMTCPDNHIISLTESGNVSATGKVEGECITTTTVNTEKVNRVTKTVTSKKKKCCSDKPLG